MVKKRHFGLLALCFGAWAHHADALEFPTEFWKNTEEGWVVEARPCDGGLCAFLVDFQPDDGHEPGYQARDQKNPDPAQRSRPLCGLRLMGGFQPSQRAEGKWEGGWVYDPESGRTYSGTISLQADGTVKMRGYIGIPLFGRSLILHRLTAAPQKCATAP